MKRRNHLGALLRNALEPIERLAQANIALIITQAVIVRLSIELADSRVDSPDPLLLVGFLATCVVAGVLVFLLNRIIRRFPKRSTRIAIAIGTVVIQAAAFQLLHAYAS